MTTFTVRQDAGRSNPDDFAVLRFLTGAPMTSGAGGCDGCPASSQLLGWLESGRVAVESNVILLRREFSLDVTQPSHPQCGNTIENRVNLFGGVFRLFCR